MGGETKAFMEMAEVIKIWTDNDLKRNYIPVWHDESYYNKYMSDKSALVLTPNYIWGSYPSFFAIKSYIDKFSSSISCDVPGSLAYDIKKLHEYKNFLDFTTNFDLSREIEEYKEENQNKKISFSPLVTEMQDLFQNETRTSKSQYFIRT